MKTAQRPAWYASHRLPPASVRTWRDVVAFPWLYVAAYARRVERVFGWRFLAFLGASQMCLKGTAYYVSAEVMLPLFKNHMGVGAYWFQLYMLLTMLPWSIKPLLGLASDRLLVCGYHKRFWLWNAAGVGIIGAGLLFVFYSSSALGVALCFGGVQYQVALFDLMSEGAYSARMREHPYTGSDLIVLTQLYQHVGGVVAMSMVGPMADASLFVPLFVVCLIMCVVPLGPTVLGWLDEQRYPYGVPQGASTACSRLGVLRVSAGMSSSSKWMSGVIAFTGVAAPVCAVISTVGDPGYGVAVATVFTGASLLGAYFVFPRLVFNVAVYQVVVLLGAPSIGGALDYFYTADEACLPGGPHFSFAYFQTYAGIVGTVCSLFGTVLYQVALSRMRFRRVFIFTAVLTGAIGLSDLAIVLRWNRALGISDHVAYIVGEAVMEPVIGMLRYIPAMALLSRACITGMESSTFAYLAGINNFAAMISRMGGAFLFRAVGVRTELPCNFDALWALVLACHCIGPLVSGVGFCFLIPDTLQTQSIDADTLAESGGGDDRELIVEELELDDFVLTEESTSDDDVVLL